MVDSLKEDIDDLHIRDTHNGTNLLTRIPSKADLNIQSDTSDDYFKVNHPETDQHQDKSKENISYKSLNDYLNQHQRFLNSVCLTISF